VLLRQVAGEVGQGGDVLGQQVDRVQLLHHRQAVLIGHDLEDLA
jgi:hypothetical protein